MKPIRVTSWDLRAAEADLDEPTRDSETGIFARIQTPGESADPSALRLVIGVRFGPGQNVPAIQTLQVDLRAPDFRSLVAVLEATIASAENAGILPKEAV